MKWVHKQSYNLKNDNSANTIGAWLFIKVRRKITWGRWFSQRAAVRSELGVSLSGRAGREEFPRPRSTKEARKKKEQKPRNTHTPTRYKIKWQQSHPTTISNKSLSVGLFFWPKKCPFLAPPSNPKTLTFDRQANSCFNPMTRRTNYRLALEISFLFILTKKYITFLKKRKLIKFCKNKFRKVSQIFFLFRIVICKNRISVFYLFYKFVLSLFANRKISRSKILWQQKRKIV